MSISIHSIRFASSKGRGGEIESLRAGLELLGARLSNSPLFKQLSGRVDAIAETWRRALEHIEREEVCSPPPFHAPPLFPHVRR